MHVSLDAESANGRHGGNMGAIKSAADAFAASSAAFMHSAVHTAVDALPIFKREYKDDAHLPLVFAAFPSSTLVAGARGASDAQNANTALFEAFEEQVQQLTILSDLTPGSLASADVSTEGFDYELKNYRAIEVAHVARVLGSSTSDGLSVAASEEGLRKHGPNALLPPREMAPRCQVHLRHV